MQFIIINVCIIHHVYFILRIVFTFLFKGNFWIIRGFLFLLVTQEFTQECLHVEYLS